MNLETKNNQTTIRGMVVRAVTVVYEQLHAQLANFNKYHPISVTAVYLLTLCLLSTPNQFPQTESIYCQLEPGWLPLEENWNRRQL